MGVPFFQTVQSFTQFLMNWTVKGGGLVDQNTANIRAEICGSCHNNRPSSEVRQGCGVCNKMGDVVINSIRDQIIKGNRTTGDGKLLACAICGCDLKISVHIPNEAFVKTDEANAYPEFCWKKKILEGQEL